MNAAKRNMTGWRKLTENKEKVISNQESQNSGYEYLEQIYKAETSIGLYRKSWAILLVSDQALSSWQLIDNRKTKTDLGIQEQRL